MYNNKEEWAFMNNIILILFILIINSLVDLYEIISKKKRNYAIHSLLIMLMLLPIFSSLVIYTDTVGISSDPITIYLIGVIALILIIQIISILKKVNNKSRHCRLLLYESLLIASLTRFIVSSLPRIWPIIVAPPGVLSLPDKAT